MSVEATDSQPEKGRHELRDYQRRKRLLDIALEREEDEGKRRHAFESLAEGASPAVRAQLMKRLQRKPRGPKSEADTGYAQGLKRDLGKVMSFKVGQAVHNEELGLEGVVIAASRTHIDVQRVINGSRIDEIVFVPVQLMDGWRGKDV